MKQDFLRIKDSDPIRNARRYWNARKDELYWQIRCNELFLISIYFQLLLIGLQVFLRINNTYLYFPILRFIASNLFRCIDTGIKPCTRDFLPSAERAFLQSFQLWCPHSLCMICCGAAGIWLCCMEEVMTTDHSEVQNGSDTHDVHQYNTTATIEPQIVDTYSVNCHIGCH